MVVHPRARARPVKDPSPQHPPTLEEMQDIEDEFIDRKVEFSKWTHIPDSVWALPPSEPSLVYNVPTESLVSSNYTEKWTARHKIRLESR